MSQFIRSPTAGIDKVLVAYNRWWAQRGKARKFLAISYEQMSADAGQVLEQTLQFAGPWTVRPELIAAAVEFSSFERLREAEATNLFQHHSMASLSADPRAAKVRSRRVGSHRAEFSEADADYVGHRISAMGDPFVDYYHTGARPADAAEPKRFAA